MLCDIKCKLITKYCKICPLTCFKIFVCYRLWNYWKKQLLPRTNKNLRKYENVFYILYSKKQIFTAYLNKFIGIESNVHVSYSSLCLLILKYTFRKGDLFSSVRCIILKRLSSLMKLKIKPDNLSNVKLLLRMCKQWNTNDLTFRYLLSFFISIYIFISSLLFFCNSRFSNNICLTFCHQLQTWDMYTVYC